jgi:hypothetical protein
MQVYIYHLVHPTTMEVRYVGKTVNLEQRYSHHLGCYHANPHLVRWIRKLRREGLKPEMVIVGICEECEWEAREKAEIAKQRRLGARLINVSDGGMGCYATRRPMPRVEGYAREAGTDLAHRTRAMRRDGLLPVRLSVRRRICRYVRKAVSVKYYECSKLRKREWPDTYILDHLNEFAQAIDGRGMTGERLLQKFKDDPHYGKQYDKVKFRVTDGPDKFWIGSRW